MYKYIKLYINNDNDENSNIRKMKYFNSPSNPYIWMKISGLKIANMVDTITIVKPMIDILTVSINLETSVFLIIKKNKNIIIKKLGNISEEVIPKILKKGMSPRKLFVMFSPKIGIFVFIL